MNYIIVGRDAANPKKPVYAFFPLDTEETMVSTLRTKAHLFEVLSGVLFIVKQLNKENFKGMTWDYEVLTKW